MRMTQDINKFYRFWSLRWKPCERIEGEFYLGPNLCNIMTHRRVWFPALKIIAPDCGRHS